MQIKIKQIKPNKITNFIQMFQYYKIQNRYKMLCEEEIAKAAMMTTYSQEEIAEVARKMCLKSQHSFVGAIVRIRELCAAGFSLNNIKKTYNLEEDNKNV